MKPYTPPKKWIDTSSGGQWATINRPVSGATHEENLPRGTHPLQLYSLGTPNGQKVTIMLEELLEAGISAAKYDAHTIKIGDGEQFSSGFVDINPNSKIPAMIDYSGEQPVKLFESGSILVYLARKFGHFLPLELEQQVPAMNWLFWLHGSAPFLGGGFGHFYSYAPEKYEYPINRYAMETKRLLDVLDKQLSKNIFVAFEQYSIADMAIWPWFGNLALGRLYDAAEFLDVQSYQHVQRWAAAIDSRPAVQRGRTVNRP